MKIACISDDNHKAREAEIYLKKYYGFLDIADDVDVIVVLGGDGFMLHNIHNYMHLDIPFYGMNVGTVGFLLNNYDIVDLPNKIKNAEKTLIYPLKMKAITTDGQSVHALAFNEVSLLRDSKQAAKITVSIDDIIQMPLLICDGVMVSTPAGSTAYNYSVGGPIIPLDAKILALTPISPFRPRRWSGALLLHQSKIKFDIIESAKRPVNVVADFIEVENIVSVEIKEDRSHKVNLLFDKDHSLENRMTKEQFSV